MKQVIPRLPFGARARRNMIAVLLAIVPGCRCRLRTDTGHRSPILPLVVVPPLDAGARGRVALLADPEGALFGVLRSATGNPED